MKQRILSGAIIAIVTIAALYFGGSFFDGVIALVIAQAAREIVCLRKDKSFNIYLFAILALFSFLVVFYGYEFSFIAVLLEIVILSTICVFDETISFSETAILFFMSIYVNYGFYIMRNLEYVDKYLLAYVFIVSYLTDTFAYFTGIKFGKHKLLERVSPKKTIEGSIGGWIIGGIASFIWASLFNFFGLGYVVFVISAIVLPVISQIGDLIFSQIKRSIGIKDFSNLIPGHGGILDRFDSVLTTSLILGVIISLI